jgi:hypothetical protein
VKCYECGIEVFSMLYKWEGNVYCYHCLHESAYALKALEDEIGIILVDTRREQDERNELAREYGLEDEIK